MGKLTGKIAEFLGQWTNDRDTEARGRAERKGSEPDDSQIEREKDRIRREHGDVNR